MPSGFVNEVWPIEQNIINTLVAMFCVFLYFVFLFFKGINLDVTVLLVFVTDYVLSDYGTGAVMGKIVLCIGENPIAWMVLYR